MKKIVLFIVLLILFSSFLVLIFNAYNLQKSYFDNKNKTQEESSLQTEEVVETPSFYTDYSKEDYDLALNNKRVLVLYFTSNWCQECLKQDVSNTEVFAELNKEGIVGLKIHILDSETTVETDSLAKKFDVNKEQSFVILDKDGAVSFKYTGILEKEVLKEEIMKLR